VLAQWLQRRGEESGQFFLGWTGKRLDRTQDLVILKGITWRRTPICPKTNTRRLTVRAAAYVVEESQEREWGALRHGALGASEGSIYLALFEARRAEPSGAEDEFD
jgi:hypothetical protein